MNSDNFGCSTYDSESELQLMGFRMYDTKTGRFTTPDLLWSAFPTQTPYHYAYNSPLTYRDPTGLAPEKEKEREELQWNLNEEDLEYLENAYRLVSNHNDARSADRDFMKGAFKTCKQAWNERPKDDKNDGGGNRTGGSKSSGENGQGGDKTTTEDYYNLGISAEDWAKMSQEDKDKALKSANDKAKELTDKTNSEWAYTIFSVTNADGTTSIVVTNFKTDMKSSTVQPDKNFPCDRPEASEVMNSDQVGDGHSHGGSNGDHSAGDLEYLYGSSMGDGTVPMNGYTSVVIGTENNYYLTVTNGILFKSQFKSSMYKTIGSGYSYGDYYGGWDDAVGGRGNAGNWGLQYYDPGKFYSPQRVKR